jgi:aspartate aminotransferase
MPISKTIAEQLTRSSWIRRMFEEGLRMKRERGEENVYDYSLGNPDVEPPAAVLAALQRAAAEARPGMHGYMPNAGYPAVRQRVAGKLARETGLPFEGEDVLMTVGAAGALNVALKAMLDPGDEVILLKPFFPDYQFYVTNHGGRVVFAETDGEFLPDPRRIAAALSPRTRALVLNTPNNPTGRIYPESVLQAVDAVLRQAPQPVVVISDEPYKQIVFDGRRQPEVAAAIANTVICNSWSKSQGLAGERIGYVAISPRLHEREQFRAACTFANRVLGFINGPAIWQRVVLETCDAVIDISGYETKRNLLCEALAQMGYEVRRPEGSFYIFLKTPIADDVEFVRLLAKQGVLTVPGTGFGWPGYIRLSLTIPLETIRRSFGGFAAALQAVRSAEAK